jgi:hypothetical protein
MLYHIFSRQIRRKSTPILRAQTSYRFVNFIPSFDNGKYMKLNKCYFVRDEVIIGWRKLHNEELHNLCSSPSTIRMIKPRRTR